MLSDWGFRMAQCLWTGPMACDAGASPRHALPAENLKLEAWGKPSLWVIISEIWYKSLERRRPWTDDMAP